MGRNFLGLIVALITAAAIFFVFMMIASMFAPQPPGNWEYRNSAEMAEFMRSLPTGAYITAAIGGLIASLAAGWMVTKISKQWRSIVLPLIVGIVLTLGGIINFSLFGGQPLWFLIACIVVTIPFVLIGHRAAR
jgi:hypothetical protein